MNFNPIWHFDATGSVIESIKQQGQPLLYSIDFHDKQQNFIFPVAEFITTGHDADNISEFLTTIKNEIMKLVP